MRSGSASPSTRSRAKIYRSSRRTSSRRPPPSSKRSKTRWFIEHRDKPSKIGGAQVVGAFVAALVDFCRRSADLVTVGIEHLQQTFLVGAYARLQMPQRIRQYEERCFHRAVIAPESHGMPC